MSEAGKEILLREGLVTHMRSTRDRQQVTHILKEERPLEDIMSWFSAFWLYHYQGVRVLSFEDAQDLTIERKDEMEREERRHLELEIRQLLSDKLREEIDIARLASELTIQICKDMQGLNIADPSTLEKCSGIIKKYLAEIPQDYSPNHDIDLVTTITGWGPKWRDELYTKASGLKETALSLRDEVLRDHPAEVIEISVLRQATRHILDSDEYLSDRLISSEITDEAMNEISTAVLNRIFGGRIPADIIRKAYEIRLEIIDILQSDFEAPTTIESYERNLGNEMAKRVGEAIKANPSGAYELLSVLFEIDAGDIKAALRSKGLVDTDDIASGLIEQTKETTLEGDGPQISAEEMEDLERSLKQLEKLEKTLEGQVKGMLRSQGLRPSELDKITVEFIAKDRDSLLGIEPKVLETLKQKARVPSPKEMERLLQVRQQLESGALSEMGMKSSSEMIQQRRHGESSGALRLDLVWHFTIGILTNLTRVVESYIRSKQDLLRMKALLKSIYEDAELELQYVREEILIDLASMRIYEFKCVNPELDASTVCSWMHARLSSKDMSAARTELDATPSPVYEGISDLPLALTSLEFDNYGIAYDLMHRFLKRERLEKLAKDELAIEVEAERQKGVEKKRGRIDVISWIDTKSKTVFRAISQVGVKGLEWSGNDQTKCSNLLAFYLRQHRGRPVCLVCGSAPKDGECTRHGTANMSISDDMDNLTVFIMEAITAMKTSLVGPKAQPMSWEKARKIAQKAISDLKRRGKLTSKTNLKELLQGEINHIVGPEISKVIGKYFDESLQYAARRSGLA
jgi:hypothetical protein